MTSPCRTDPAIPVISAAINALRTWFGPTNTACPPKVGTSEHVRFFAGDGAPMVAWDSHASQSCATPFLWVRAMRRYRTAAFPREELAATNPCGLPRVMPVELGVGWCAYVPDADRVDWNEYAAEAAVSLDTSWRLEEALCTAAGLLDTTDDEGRQIGTGTLVPYGPEGGVIAWTGVLYATY